MVRVDNEGGWVFRPDITDGLEGSSPSKRFEVLGEVVGSDESVEMSLQAVEGLVMEGWHGGVFDSSGHRLGLAIAPRAVGLGELVGDVVLAADAIEGMQAVTGCRTRAIAGLVGKGDAVVGQDGVQLVRESRDHPARKPAPASMVAAR